ncbi:STIP1 y and U box-containing protein 1 [Clydaea vesicula]|uniref:RING-type E3 ubiquitin transferase n=1 Tax=Clydaea vesicula TaxID=447962 RepID=A0AAD5U313_9FUNG|nr:STIP1 y and U box-containing protein 1 [Clydaea vesicula]
MNFQTSSEEFRKKGNDFFHQGLYEEAIKQYTTAIIKNPNNPLCYTNRALSYLKLNKFENVIQDCEKGLDLDPNSVKAHYLLGQALTHTSRLNESISHLKKAYALGVSQNVNYTADILAASRKVKTLKWEQMDLKRRETESDLYRYLTGLIERDRRRMLQEINEADSEYVDITNYEHDQRRSQVELLFSQADENGKKREIPDYVCGKISFELMSDPVIKPSFSRKPLLEKDLIPNLAMKEVVDTFIEKNG